MVRIFRLWYSRHTLYRTVIVVVYLLMSFVFKSKPYKTNKTVYVYHTQFKLKLHTFFSIKRECNTLRLFKIVI